MPYYTFKIYSSGKNVLSKQFSTQDCIDLHFLLANEDYTGVDLFCQLKFEEYTNDKTRLNSLDKFLFLVSQKIISHTFDTSVVHSIQGSETKLTKLVSLVKIYNTISDISFKVKNVFSEGNLQIEYGIPYDLADKKSFNFYSIKLGDVEYKDVNEYDCSSLSFLPVKLYMDLQNMQLENNKKIKSEYFQSNFIRELTFSNECFLYFLDFIYSENVADFFSLTYNMNKDFGVAFSHLKSITMRELYLLVDTINKSTQDKKKKTTDERAI